MKLVTLAPEVPGGRGAGPCARRSRGHRFAGHTAIGAQEAFAIVDAGATPSRISSTRWRPCTTAHPGLVGAALADERLTPMVIADGVHVDPLASAPSIERAAGERVALVSDSEPRGGRRRGRATASRACAMQRRGDIVTDAEGRLRAPALLDCIAPAALRERPARPGRRGVGRRLREAGRRSSASDPGSPPARRQPRPLRRDLAIAARDVPRRVGSSERLRGRCARASRTSATRSAASPVPPSRRRESCARRKYRGAACSHVAPIPPWTEITSRAAKSRARRPRPARGARGEGNSSGLSRYAQPA